MKYKNTSFSEAGLLAVQKMNFLEFQKSYKGIIKGDLKEAYKMLGGGQKAKKVIKESEADEQE